MSGQFQILIARKVEIERRKHIRLFRTTLTQSQLETLKVASETTESELTEKIAGQTATIEAKEKEATAADAAIVATGKEVASLKAQLTESKNE